MILKTLEIKNYRSIEYQWDSEKIHFEGLDCIVGPNNSGKSNLLNAIRFLLGAENENDEEVFFQGELEREIEVRGFFEVEEQDFDLLEQEEKVEKIKRHVLDDGTLGISRSATHDEIQDIEIVDLYPPEDHRLNPDNFAEYHENTWSARDSGADFRDRMLDQYPELESYLESGKETNKGEWEKAYDEMIASDGFPDEVELVKLSRPPETGIPADLKNMLPRPVYIPPVKEASEATRTSRREAFGELIQELGAEIKDELDETIKEAMESVHRLLNVYEDDGQRVDDRHEGVREIENRITNYLRETFQNYSVSLRFPNPETIDIMKDAEVRIEEEGTGTFNLEQHGEGVKRILIFSLIRTLADLRSDELQFGEEDEESTEEESPQRSSILILFEEAELFLHPGLQTILLRAFRRLVNESAQVIFSTHSPVLINETLLDSINLVSRQVNSTETANFLGQLEQRDLGRKKRLTKIQNVSRYLFSNKVVLVEGPSDKIILTKLAKLINSDWDFEARSIPILPVNGKGNLPLFKDFLEDVDIDVYLMTDIDSLHRGLEDLVDLQELAEKREEVLELARGKVEEDDIDNSVNSRDISNVVRSYVWDEVFERLSELFEHLDQNQYESIEDVHTGSLQRLVSQKEEMALKKALKADYDDIEGLRDDIIESLLYEDILMLNGDIEDYYPSNNSGGNKVESAIYFDPSETTIEDIRGRFTYLEETEDYAIELFLQSVFD